jgi:hypothetical protein
LSRETVTEPQVRSAEVFNQHQVASILIVLGVQNRPAVRRNLDVIEDRLLDRENLARLASGELLQTYVAASLRVRWSEEVDPLFPESPMTSAMDGIQNQGFFPSTERHPINSAPVRIGIAFRVVEEFPVGRFLWTFSIFSVRGDLNRVTASGRHFPDLLCPAPIRGEVN